jgi:general stress protein 26
MAIRNYEDVTVYGLDADREAELIKLQNECTFCWVTKDGAPMASIMSYVRTDDGHFWLTSAAHRKRVPAIQRDARVAIVVSSAGTAMRASKTVTYKGVAIVHRDDETKRWYYPALAERIMSRYGQERVDEFAHMLDSPDRIMIEVVPGLRVGYDGDKMAKATIEAREAGVLKWAD